MGLVTSSISFIRWFPALVALPFAIPAYAQTARIEIHAVRTTTLTDEQFLRQG